MSKDNNGWIDINETAPPTNEDGESRSLLR